MATDHRFELRRATVGRGSMKLLVTGREGQLARSLVERASCVEGVEVITLGRPELDLERLDTIAPAVARVSPDVVINAAAYTAVDQAEDEADVAHRVNAVAPGHLAAAARLTGARFVQISTDYVYAGVGERPLVEDDATGPISIYGRTKLIGEEAAKAACAETVVLRTAWVYSPFGRNFVRTMMSLADTRDTLTVVGDQFGNPSSALDIADGILTLLGRWAQVTRIGLGTTYHLAGTGSTSWAGFAAEIMRFRAELDLRSAAVTPIPSTDWITRAARPKNSRLDCSAFSRDFGYAAPRWQDSTAEVVRRLAA